MRLSTDSVAKLTLATAGRRRCGLVLRVSRLHPMYVTGCTSCTVLCAMSQSSPVEVRSPVTALLPDDLRARREALGLTQAKLAETLGVTPTTVARWERSERPMS